MKKKINNDRGITIHLNESHNYDVRVSRTGVHVHVNYNASGVPTIEWACKDYQFTPTKTHVDCIIARLHAQQRTIDEVINLLRQDDDE